MKVFFDLILMLILILILILIHYYLDFTVIYSIIKII
jgi:hypothetical protein